VIRFVNVSFRYDAAAAPVLRDVDLTVEEGELCLVVGTTGTGKSTLLRTVNGLVPHFTGGVLAGRVEVDGRDTRSHRPRDLVDVIGYVGQDPRAGFVTDVVEDELAYAMESLGVPPDIMRRRVEETLDLLGLDGVRDRPLATLSGGQAQRVAIGSALTAHPRALVLDEPTSALDPVGAEEVLATLQRLVHDLGLTVLLAEHRLERVVHYADRIIILAGGGAPVRSGPPAEIMNGSPVAPPVVELGRLAGWRPLPLSVRDARRAAAGLRRRLEGRAGAEGHGDGPPARDTDGTPDQRAGATPLENREGAPAQDGGARPVAQGATPIEDWGAPPVARAATPIEDGGSRPVARPAAAASVATARRVHAHYGPVPALRGAGLTVSRGEVVALMGRNGAGKSTLLGALAGVVRPDAGRVEVLGRAPHELAAAALVRRVGLVPQDPGDLLYADSVAAECRQADRDAEAAEGTCRALLDRLAPGVDGRTHPRDLSEGQRLALSLAVILAGGPPLILLDEPTRGLDYPAKRRLVAVLRELAAAGHAIVLATHDVELAAEASTRTVVAAEGEIVADGPTARIVTSSPAFAPQVAKILAPVPLLTVGEVRTALGRPA
jgi:energy-coupling factor transporter ATP-binding protein EcfA2